ncbi:MAG: hypothetical protein HC842_09145 [Cytophagales bacterium]|nr:hypothetical protein [Cytophagales bacterium]
MKNPTFFLMFIILMLIGCQPQKPIQTTSTTLDSLAEGFANPPMSAKPKALWDWVNGNANLSRITEELEAAKAKGMSGFDIWDVGILVDDNQVVPAGPPFLSDPSLQAIGHAIREATRLGMELGLITSSSWNSGGTWTRPEHTAMALYRTYHQSAGGAIDLELSFPAMPERYGRHKTLIEKDTVSGRPVFYQDVCVLAIGTTSDSLLQSDQIIDLSPYLRGDRLVASLPEGQWTLVRYTCAPSGQSLAIPSTNSQAPMMDHFSAEAQKANLQYIFSRLQTEVPDIKQSALKYLYVDSYEVNSGIWTPRLVDYFDSLMGYSPLPYLPVLDGYVVENEEISSRFLEDFNKVLSEMIIQNHYRLGRQICEQHGIGYAAEAGGPGQPITMCPLKT